ncbi:MAG: hypothetical protein GC180_07885 [Bacteroidetes bacterium]|nr:hypothetical protein [Bacteroidota bacterium]
MIAAKGFVFLRIYSGSRETFLSPWQFSISFVNGSGFAVLLSWVLCSQAAFNSEGTGEFTGIEAGEKVRRACWDDNLATDL